MNILLLGTALFILTLFVVELCAYAVRLIQYPDRAEIRKRMRRSLAAATEEESRDIIKKKVLSDVPFLNQLLSSLPGLERLELQMRQANVKYTVGFFILLSAALGFMGYVVVGLFMRAPGVALMVGLGAACLPLLDLRSKRKKRMARFEKQLPDGLGLIARSLRAGHAFASGMKFAAEEFADPLGPEFEETLDEINFGLSVPEALKNLSRRVDCPDLSFFVVAVILQRETGGNLAEIIDNLAHLMRERFRFRGKVRIVSAEGRLTGKILVAVPLVMFAAMYLLNPEYAGKLIFDPLGRAMAGGALFLMIIGALVIGRIVKLDV